MKYCLILIIKFYWIIIPTSKRNKCLYKESCSNKVYNDTLREGLFKGLLSLYQRIKNCRPGYSLILINDEVIMRLKDGSILTEGQINVDILSDFKKIHSKN
jgi:hypothetical protein